MDVTSLYLVWKLMYGGGPYKPAYKMRLITSVVLECTTVTRTDLPILVNFGIVNV